MAIDETWLLPFIGSAASEGGLAFDIGANVGEVTEVLAENFDGVLAVEPDPRAFETLLARGLKNVGCQHCAAAARNGAAELLLRPHSVQSSLLEQHPIGAGDQSPAPIIERVGVNTLTLDFLLFVARQTFGEMPLRFVKIDVEGYEGDVLAGATDPVFRSVRWLIEVHDREIEVGVQLERLGYDEIEVIPHPVKSAHPKHFWIYAEPAE